MLTVQPYEAIYGTNDDCKIVQTQPLDATEHGTSKHCISRMWRLIRPPSWN